MHASSFRRLALLVLAGISVLLYATGIFPSPWSLVIGILAFFLGVTDFGRQCPLILSARSLLSRMRSKG